MVFCMKPQCWLDSLPSETLQTLVLSEGQPLPPSLICKSVRVSLHKEATPIPLTSHFPGCLYLPHQLSNKESCWLFTPKALLQPGALWRFINTTRPSPSFLTSTPLRWQLNHAEQQSTWVQPLAIGQWPPHCWQEDVTQVVSDLSNLLTKNRAKKMYKKVKNKETNCNKMKGWGMQVFSGY